MQSHALAHPRSSPNFWQDFWGKGKTGKGDQGGHDSTDRILLAPMEGVVDRAMRDLITRIGGVDLCVTEFIRVTDRLLPDWIFHKDCPELAQGSRTPSGVPVLVQLLGGQPEPMAENARRAIELGAFGIDLNFGCPAKTVNRHDGGAALLKNPHRVHDVVSAVRKSVPAEFSVSAKVRLGFSDKTLSVEIAQAAESGGASWLTVHARTRDEGYRPPAHWEYIARMREATRLVVIANGEIWTKEDYATIREVSGCRHVMIGRPLMTDPSLAREIKGLGEAASWDEVCGWLKIFAHASAADRGEHYAVCRVKQWMKSLGRRHSQAASLFEEIKRHETLTPILSQVRNQIGFTPQ